MKDDRSWSAWMSSAAHVSAFVEKSFTEEELSDDRIVTLDHYHKSVGCLDYSHVHRYWWRGESRSKGLRMEYERMQLVEGD